MRENGREEGTEEGRKEERKKRKQKGGRKEERGEERQIEIACKKKKKKPLELATCLIPLKTITLRHQIFTHKVTLTLQKQQRIGNCAIDYLL